MRISENLKSEKTLRFSTSWETYRELPKELGQHPDLNEPIFADMSINGPCVWTIRDDKKIFGSPDEDEHILDIGLNRAVELIERDSGENILFIEENSGIQIFLKNGRFGEYTEFDGFNKASKLPPEDKPKNPKVFKKQPTFSENTVLPPNLSIVFLKFFGFFENSGFGLSF